jgi:hypothetical protein
VSTTDGARAKAKAGASPAKLALIAILALALIGVIASNFTSSGEPAAESHSAQEVPRAGTAPSTATSTPAARVAQAETANPLGDFAADESWPEPAMREVTRFDPFAAPEWAVAASGEQAADEEVSAKQLNELLSSKDAIIFMSGDKRVARIGKMEFRVGDVIGHYKISDITSQGVVLSEAQ